MLCMYVFLLLAVSRAGFATLQDKQTDFSLKLFARLAQGAPDSNLVLSPYGVTSLLGMVQLGAAGNTRKALDVAMGFSLQERGMSQQQRDLQRSLSGEDGVEMASGVMVERMMKLERMYRRALAKAFLTKPHQVDFTKPHQAVRIINAWVSDHTAGTIPKFFPPGSLPDDTRLVLLNALHFQRLWKVPFDPRLTQERMFHCANGSAVPVQMMQLTNSFNYGQFVTAGGVEYDVIEVPYEGDSLSMLLVSPFEPDVPLSVLAADMTSRRMGQWRTQMRAMKRQLSMPRFTMTSEVNLKTTLVNMGLKDMFSHAADFSRITASEPLCVSKVLQQVKIEVTEEGTKGSAATAAVLFLRMAVEEITLNRPFIFIIQHKSTGAVLLMGQFNHPQQDQTSR